MDDVALSADTLKILNEFLNEQKQKEESSTTATGLFEQENWVSFIFINLLSRSNMFLEIFDIF